MESPKAGYGAPPTPPASPHARGVDDGGGASLTPRTPPQDWSAASPRAPMVRPAEDGGAVPHYELGASIRTAHENGENIARLSNLRDRRAAPRKSGDKVGAARVGGLHKNGGDAGVRKRAERWTDSYERAS